MATKQDLLRDYISSEDIVKYAESAHNVRLCLCFVKRIGDQNYVAQACMKDNESDKFQGEGRSQREAIADCIAMRFPD